MEGQGLVRRLRVTGLQVEVRGQTLVYPQQSEPEVHEGGHRSGYLASAAVGEGS